MIIDADMYGIIPNAKIEALEKAPPEKRFKRSPKPPPPLTEALSKALLSTPGIMIKEPILYIRTSPNVNKIFFFNSSMDQMSFIF